MMTNKTKTESKYDQRDTRAAEGRVRPECCQLVETFYGSRLEPERVGLWASIWCLRGNELTDSVCVASRSRCTSDTLAIQVLVG
jgi:hypothetical protein